MKNQIKFKTIGFIALDSFKVKTRNGRTKTIVNVYSTAILKGKDAFKRAKAIVNTAKTNKVVREHLKLVSNALDIVNYAKKIETASLHIAKTRVNKGLMNRIKHIYSTAIEYTKISTYKALIKRILNKLDSTSKELLMDFFDLSPSLEFNLRFFAKYL